MSTKIEWTEKTLNINTGCTPISAGCKNCYARAMHERLQAMGQPKYQHSFNEVWGFPEELEKIKRWKKTSMIFVNSMSDLFHKANPYTFIHQAIDTFSKHPHHTFQILTKRADRMAEFFEDIVVPKNVWVGVTVEDADNTERIYHLTRIQAPVRFVSFEPLLTRIPVSKLKQMICGTGAFTDQPYKTKIGWAIVGGETGHHSRPMSIQWAMEIKDFCLEHEIPFFFKKLGGPDKKISKCRTLGGQLWEQWPEHYKDQ